MLENCAFYVNSILKEYLKKKIRQTTMENQMEQKYNINEGT